MRVGFGGGGLQIQVVFYCFEKYHGSDITKWRGYDGFLLDKLFKAKLVFLQICTSLAGS